MDSAPATTPPTDNGAFTIVSYNICHGKNLDGILDLNAPGLVVKQENPRFVGLQEVDQLTTRVGGADTCAIISEATGLHATFAKAIDYAGGEYGNALFSRETPLNVRRIPLPGAEPRVLLLCEFDDCWVGVMHLAVDSAQARIQSVDIVRDAVEACGDKPVFLMGDWNANPDSVVLTSLRGFLTVLSDENTATLQDLDFNPENRRNRTRCIDYIAIDTAHLSKYRLLNRHVIEERHVSDHAPQMIRVAPYA